MKYPLLVIAFLAFNLLTAQDKIPEYGQIDEQSLNLKSCKFEPGAEAMVLFDHSKITLVIDGYLLRATTERRVRIKVFTEKGFEHANVTIPYVNRRRQNRIKDISGFTYNFGPEGKVVTEKIERNQIFKNKADDEIREISFAFPGVKAGSVLEYRYTQIETNTLNYQPWLIQTEIPVEKTIIEWDVAPDLEFSYRQLYQLPIEKKDTFYYEKYRREKRIISFTGKNIPSFKLEPFMSSLKDNLQRVEFSIPFGLGFGSSRFGWNRINDVLFSSQYLGKWIKAEVSGTLPLLDSAKKLQGKDEKIKFLLDGVRKRITWDKGLSFGAEDLAECWKERLGTSGEMNLLLLNLLNRAGVYSVPLLVSTRKNGKVIKDFVSIGQFNSVAIWIPDSTQAYIIDATRKYASFKTTPYDILNRNAYAIDSLSGQWVYIADPRPLHKQAINVLVRFDSTEKLTGETAVYLFDYAKEDELKSREKEKDKEEDEKKPVALTISDYSEQDADDPDKPLVQKFKFNYETTRTNDLYYFSPVFLSSLKDNPFTAESRQTDVDLGANQMINFTVVIMLPQNLKVEFLPGNIWLRNQDSTISFQRLNSVETNRAVIKFTLEIKKPIIPKEEYPELRDFYKKLFALLNEQIVLKKVE